jgi:uncharacterized membrane protein
VVFGTEQLNASPLLFEIAAIGTVLSKVVVTDAVSEQPLALVTVTVNVPAVLTDNVAEVPTSEVPSDQE